MRPRLAVALVSALVLLLGAWACFGPEERIAFLFYDDAYYYLGVARHVAAGEGSTFDGLHRTNGYHPLWCALLVPVVKAFADPGAGVRAAAALWFLLAAAVPWALWWALRRRLGDGIAATAAVLFSTAPWLGLSLARPNGLETPLLALLVAGVVGAADRWEGRGFALGALAGLATLARLDAGFLAMAVALDAGRRSWSRAALIAAGAAVVVAPYLVWNQAQYGHPLPVSGRVLSLEAEKVREAHGGTLTLGNAVERARIAVFDIPKRIAERSLHGVPVPLSTGAMVFVLLALGAWRRSAPFTVVAYAILHGAAYALWLWTAGEDVYRAYYFLPQVLLGAILAASGLAWVAERTIPKGRAILASAGLVLLAAHLVLQARAQAGTAVPGPVASRHVYGWIREHLPEDAVLGARDAGKLGWFSGRRVVNLDGLINDAAFLEALRTNAVDAYICASPIRYLFYDRPFVATKLTGDGACRVRDAGPATDDWVVLEVVRDGTSAGAARP